MPVGIPPQNGICAVCANRTVYMPWGRQNHSRDFCNNCWVEVDYEKTFIIAGIGSNRFGELFVGAQAVMPKHSPPQYRDLDSWACPETAELQTFSLKRAIGLKRFDISQGGLGARDSQLKVELSVICKLYPGFSKRITKKPRNSVLTRSLISEAFKSGKYYESGKDIPIAEIESLVIDAQSEYWYI
jgi:hypothetical protein